MLMVRKLRDVKAAVEDVIVLVGRGVDGGVGGGVWWTEGCLGAGGGGR